MARTITEQPPDDATWSERAPEFVAAGEYVVWYKVSAEGASDYVHPAKVVITQRPIRVVSRSFTWSQTAGHNNFAKPQAKIVEGTLATGEELRCSEFATHPGLAADEPHKTVQNTFTAKVYKGETETTDNYAITQETGDLKVIDAHLLSETPIFGANPDPTNTTWSVGRISGFDYWAKYDGVAHTIDTANLIAHINELIADAQGHGMSGAATAVATYRYAQGSEVGGNEPAEDAWGTEAPTFAEAGVYSVWYEVVIESANVAYRRESMVKIEQRTLEVSSGTGNWSYDGEAHKDTYIGVAGDGLAPGEELDLAVPDTEIIEVGSVVNALGVPKVWRGEGESRRETTGNYIISKVEGTLTVNAAANPFARGEVIDRNTPEGAVSTYDVTVVYDGAAHTIDTERLMVDAENAVYEALKREGEETWKVEYWFDTRTDGDAGSVAPIGVEWQTSVPGFVNAGEYSVWYRVVDTAENCTAWAHAAKVTILKREVMLASEDGTWRWDGATHENPTAHVMVGEPAAGHAFDFSGFATVRDVGKTENTFDYTLVDATQEGRPALSEEVTANYEITRDFGLLTVTAGSETAAFVELVIQVPAKEKAVLAGMPFTAGAGRGGVDWRGVIVTDNLAVGAHGVGSAKVWVPDGQGGYGAYYYNGNGAWVHNDGREVGTVETGSAWWIENPNGNDVTLRGVIERAAVPEVRIVKGSNLVSFPTAQTVDIARLDWTGNAKPKLYDRIEMVDGTGTVIVYQYLSGRWANASVKPSVDKTLPKYAVPGYGFVYVHGGDGLTLPVVEEEELEND